LHFAARVPGVFRYAKEPDNGVDDEVGASEESCYHQRGGNTANNSSAGDPDRERVAVAACHRRDDSALRRGWHLSRRGAREREAAEDIFYTRRTTDPRWRIIYTLRPDSANPTTAEVIIIGPREADAVYVEVMSRLSRPLGPAHPQV
jgi:hypothetical protein